MCTCHPEQVTSTSKHNTHVVSDTVRLLTRGLWTQKRCWAALQEWWIYQDNRKNVGVRGGERERHRARERERAHWASLYLSKDATLPSFHLLFWPQGLRGPARLEQMQHFQYKSLNPNTQMRTYIFLSLQLSSLSHSFPPYNSLSAHPQGKAWIWSRQPKKHMQTLFLCVSSLKCGTGGLHCYVYLFINLFI